MLKCSVLYSFLLDFDVNFYMLQKVNRIHQLKVSLK